MSAVDAVLFGVIAGLTAGGIHGALMAVKEQRRKKQDAVWIAKVMEQMEDQS